MNSAGPTPELTFRHREDGEFHYLTAWLAEGRRVGLISWSKLHGGQLLDVEVHPDYRRRGVATALWNAALASSWTPEIRMTPHRTDTGEAWASSLGIGVGRQPWDGTVESYWTD